MWQLYEEAVALAAQLLPSTHALKLDAEKAGETIFENIRSWGEREVLCTCIYGLVEIYHPWYDVKFVYQEGRDDMFV